MKKQENKNRRNFLLCMGGLLVLIVFAFAEPKRLLQLQDKSRLTQSVSISNTGTDYTVWKEEYETDTVRRLQNLADGIAAGKQYYISEQDYEAETDGEIYSLIDEYISRQIPFDSITTARRFGTAIRPLQISEKSHTASSEQTAPKKAAIPYPTRYHPIRLQRPIRYSKAFSP